MTDPIADMINRLRTALASQKKEVVLPYSKTKERVARILQKEGYIDDLANVDQGIGKKLKIRLGYVDGKQPKIRELHRISKPGRRVYQGYRGLRPVKNGLGLAILSTSRGFMTDRQARKEKMGGEIILEIF